METTSISETTATAPPPAKNVSATDTGDFHTFLTLLTAQMRNQDPLKPMDSTEFVAQLASFSAVEQQIETNTKLTELIGMFGESPAATLTEWIGKEVQREGSTEFTGSPIEVGVTIPAAADGAHLVVRDQNNAIIFAKVLDTSAKAAEWNGETSGGVTAPLGRYSFTVESNAADGPLEVRDGLVFDLVSEVRLDQGAIALLFGDGSRINVEDATAIRLPKS